MKIISTISVISLASIGIFVTYWNIIETTYLYTYSGVTSGITLVFWSVLLGLSQKKSYKGGAAAILGVMFLTIAFILLFHLCFLVSFENLKKLSSELFSTTFFLIAGIALLKQGHQYHRMLISNPSIKRDA